MLDLLHLHSVLTPPSPESAPEAEEGVMSQKCISEMESLETDMNYTYRAWPRYFRHPQAPVDPPHGNR